MRKIPEPSRANTIRFPSGENAGSVADLLPVVICCSPAVRLDAHQLERAAGRRSDARRTRSSAPGPERRGGLAGHDRDSRERDD